MFDRLIAGTLFLLVMVSLLFVFVEVVHNSPDVVRGIVETLKGR